MPGKVAIVTGGASGIGRAMCRRFLLEEAKVVVADRNHAGTEETRSLLEDAANIAASAVNASDSAQAQRMVDDMVSQFGKQDVLVNGAAISIWTPPLAKVDDLDWDLTWTPISRASFTVASTPYLHNHQWRRVHREHSFHG